MTILWFSIGKSFLTVAIVFGGLVAVVCGVGFVYYGTFFFPFCFRIIVKHFYRERYCNYFIKTRKELYPQTFVYEGS
jgi:hypothetical protein